MVKRYEVQINKPNQDHKLVIAQFKAVKSKLDLDLDRLNLNVKPKCMKLKLDVDIDSSSRLRPQPTKNVYTSTKEDIAESELFVCKIVNEKLICQPVSDFVSFRSDLTHLDVKEETDPREEVRPVSVKFAANDRQNAPVKSNDLHLEESLEDYREFKLEAILSAEAKLQREYLFCIPQIDVKIKPDPEAIHQNNQKRSLTQEDCDIKPKIETLDVGDIYSSDMRNQPSFPKTANLIRSRIRECLMKAEIVSFEEVYNFLREYRDISSEKLHGHEMVINIKDIIDSLNELAILVQGNWAIKSEIRYGDSTIRESTDVTGIPINHFIAARDYLLWLFNQDRLVSRPSFTKQARIPDYDALKLFNQLGILRRDSRKWELKLPTDDKFIEKFPEVVQRQNTFWKVRRANKLNIFFKN